MHSKFLSLVDPAALALAVNAKDYDKLYDMLVQPLHEELYRLGSFEQIASLSKGQQLLLAYDYVRAQVGQGGFIQFIQNGYVGLLPDIIGELMRIGGNNMAHILDDVLKVYVLNRDLLEKQTTVAEFARLYDELKEFEGIEERFNQYNTLTIQLMIVYALANPDEFFSSGKK